MLLYMLSWAYWIAFVFALAVVVALVAAAGLVGFTWKKASVEEKSAIRKAFQSTKDYARCLVFFVRGGSYSECPLFQEKKEVKARIYGLALTFLLWNKPHYRHGTFQDDLKKNLRNVAIPGTGLPLSVFAFAKPLAYFLVFVVKPLANLAAAVHLGRRDVSRVCKEYEEHLLTPTDWFSFWRLNCALASYHASVTGEPTYELEDKLKFLQVAQQKDIAVSPFLDIPALICKHRNEEGGLGYMFYKNALNGGDWIIQEVLENSEPIKSLLPDNAPLSTFRVITVSSCQENKVSALSCVWRAGLKGAITDHSAILFDVNSKANCFKKGITNGHWYKLGFDKIFSTKWTAEHDISHHPDNGKKIEGEKIDAIAIMEFAQHAHRTLMPRIPIIGWDVALTNKGMLLLECNLSCNFFLGSFDVPLYFEFVDKYFAWLEMEAEQVKDVKDKVKGTIQTPPVQY